MDNQSKDFFLNNTQNNGNLKKLKDIEELKNYFKEGLNYLQIAVKMGYSVDYIYELRRECIKKNIWFSVEEYEEIKKNRKRNMSVKKESDEEENKNDKTSINYKKRSVTQKNNSGQKKSKIIKSKEMSRIKKEEEEQRKRAEIEREFKIIRRNAYKEDRMEYIGEEFVTTENREKYIEFIKANTEIEYMLDKKDIDLILNILYINPKFANKDILKILISTSIKEGGYNYAKEKTKELTEIFEGTKYEGPLSKYYSWINYKLCVPKIKEMRSKKMSTEEISQKLRLTTAEVTVLLNDEMIEPNF